MRRLLITLLLVGAALGAQRVAPAGEPAAPPRVHITSPRGGQTDQRVVSIQGSVEGVEAKRLTLVLNGIPLSIPREGANFKSEQVLSPGWNSIRVVAAQGARHAADEVAVFARVPPKDLRITLTWDTPATDMDLWVTGPDGEKISYQNKQGKQGGTLDVDVTTGYGPETYTQARLPSGTYRVQVHYYGGSRPTRVTATVVQREGRPDEARRAMRGILLRSGEILEVGEIAVP